MIMANGMDSNVKKGKDLEGDIKKGESDIAKIGDEFKGVKDQLKDMPGGLDSDLVQMIQDVETSGRAEALSDIESAKSSIIDKAKAESDTLRSDVQTKIADNTAARGKLDGLKSKYGRDSAAQAKAAIDANSKKGDDLLKALETAIKNADTSVQGVKDKL